MESAIPDSPNFSGNVPLKSLDAVAKNASETPDRRAAARATAHDLAAALGTNMKWTPSNWTH